MSLLGRLREWVGSLFGAAESDESAGDAAAESPPAPGEESPADEPAYKCAVCGTGVEAADGPCPLCNSTDVVPALGAPTDTAGENPDATRVHRARTPDAAAGGRGVDAEGDRAVGEDETEGAGESEESEGGDGLDPDHVRRAASDRDDSEAVSRLQELRREREADEE